MAYRENYTRSMVSYTYSLANLANIFVWAVIVILPLAIVLQTGGLWVKSSVYLEQPSFNYAGKLYGQFVFADKADASKTAQFDYSTSKPLRYQI